MIRQFSTVGGLTLLSRITGFLRDIMLAAILGAPRAWSRSASSAAATAGRISARI